MLNLRLPFVALFETDEGKFVSLYNILGLEHTGTLGFPNIDQISEAAPGIEEKIEHMREPITVLDTLDAVMDMGSWLNYNGLLLYEGQALEEILFRRLSHGEDFVEELKIITDAHRDYHENFYGIKGKLKSGDYQTAESMLEPDSYRQREELLDLIIGNIKRNVGYNRIDDVQKDIQALQRFSDLLGGDDPFEKRGEVLDDIYDEITKNIGYSWWNDAVKQSQKLAGINSMMGGDQTSLHVYVSQKKGSLEDRAALMEKCDKGIADTMHMGISTVLEPKYDESVAIIGLLPLIDNPDPAQNKEFYVALEEEVYAKLNSEFSYGVGVSRSGSLQYPDRAVAVINNLNPLLGTLKSYIDGNTDSVEIHVQGGIYSIYVENIEAMQTKFVKSYKGSQDRKDLLFVMDKLKNQEFEDKTYASPMFIWMEKNIETPSRDFQK